MGIRIELSRKAWEELLDPARLVPGCLRKLSPGSGISI